MPLPTECCNDDKQTVTQALRNLGVDILEPRSESELELAESFHAFSSFVLFDEMSMCQSIIDRHLTSGEEKCGGVGVLQGGGECDIYRLQIREDGSDKEEDGGGSCGHNPGTAAATEILQAFHSSRYGSRHRKRLTVARLQQYLLNMCERWRQNRPNGSPESCRRYTGLGNLMFILSFGPVFGQPRHIDNMDPNNQICCYMSEQCPSTILYDLEGPDITCGEDLIDYWDQTLDDAVPNLVKEIFASKCDERLDDLSRRAYIPPRLAAWGSINGCLSRFGKLYRPVKKCLSLSTDPGTTLVAGGNEVHAGPPATGPRMFAFAVGIPETEEEEDEFGSDSDDERSNRQEATNNSGDGEVQYCPALLHVDLCSILFAMMQNECASQDASERDDSKRFLLRILVQFIAEKPNETYAENLTDSRRRALLEWVEQICDRIQLDFGYDDLIEEAVKRDDVICGEIQGVVAKKMKAKGRRRRLRGD